MDSARIAHGWELDHAESHGNRDFKLHLEMARALMAWAMRIHAKLHSERRVVFCTAQAQRSAQKRGCREATGVCGCMEEGVPTHREIDAIENEGR